MIKLKKTILIASFLYLSTYASVAFGYCDDARSEALGKKSQSLNALNQNLVSCKKNPVKNETFFVFGHKNPNADNEGFYAVDADILVVDDVNNNVISHAFFPHLWRDEDTNTLRYLTIDTAKYIIAKDQRAFGVIAEYEGASRADPSGERSLALFIRLQNNIKIILKNMKTFNYGGEWDTNCAGNFSEVKKTLVMAQTTSNGFFDIQIMEIATQSKNKKTKNDCKRIVLKSSENSYFIKFNGDVYAQ
jgi:hypothetical protein